MQLTSVFALATTLATFVSAQDIQSLPSPQEIEAQIAELYASDPVYSSLTAYYATHTFSTGSKLLSWLSKVQTMAVISDIAGENENDNGPNSQQIEQLQEAYSELPVSEYSDLLFQYFPTAIVAQPTEIIDYINQLGTALAASEGLQAEASSFASTAEETGSKQATATASSGSLITSVASSVVTSNLSEASSEPASSDSENSSSDASKPASSDSKSSASEASKPASSASKDSASASSEPASSASASASSSSSQTNAAPHMGFSSAVVLGLSVSVAALIMI